MSNKFSEMNVEELKTKLQVAKRNQMVVASIFGVMILAWIVLGYWRTNVPVFVITIALAIILTTTLSAPARQMAAELEKRNGQ